MLRKSNETLPQTRDSFYDDGDDDDKNNNNNNNDDNNITPRPPQLISSIRIVTSKPPVYRRQSPNSSSPSPSSGCSDHDVTDVSSLAGDHQQFEHKQHDNHRRHSAHEQHHPFHLQSMRHVLLGSTTPTSRPPSPAHHQQQLNKKHVRIVTDDIDKSHQHHQSQHRPPYIHNHTRDHRRVRLTSSAINRQKQQQKIERENLRLLDRLQQTRASRGIKRDELLDNYDYQMGYTTFSMPPPPVPPPRAQPLTRPSSATSMASRLPTSQKKLNTQSRPSSASHTINSNNARSRPNSASTSLHGSSRSSSSARRPIWNDRWQKHE
ncbi:unnamed protein product [Adineta steineri]|uniref:Uncharacterized protein n=1 Tax=Adineta steineri TaxID=433720 RepID=A0A819H251_9BILA|nr:unnamed protein product [Adineta steineri]